MDLDNISSLYSAFSTSLEMMEDRGNLKRIFRVKRVKKFTNREFWRKICEF